MSETQHADRPDHLDALADRLDDMADARNFARLNSFSTPDPDILRTAARILRAVAAAPGPLRDWGDWVEWSDEAVDWFDALADAVGEP